MRCVNGTSREMDKVNLLVNKYNFIEADEMFVQLGLTGQQQQQGYQARDSYQVIKSSKLSLP